MQMHKLSMALLRNGKKKASLDYFLASSSKSHHKFLIFTYF